MAKNEKLNLTAIRAEYNAKFEGSNFLLELSKIVNILKEADGLDETAIMLLLIEDEETTKAYVNLRDNLAKIGKDLKQILVQYLRNTATFVKPKK